jgi:hypothetical protein
MRSLRARKLLKTLGTASNTNGSRELLSTNVTTNSTNRERVFTVNLTVHRKHEHLLDQQAVQLVADVQQSGERIITAREEEPGDIC